MISFHVQIFHSNRFQYNLIVVLNRFVSFVWNTRRILFCRVISFRSFMDNSYVPSRSSFPSKNSQPTPNPPIVVNPNSLLGCCPDKSFLQKSFVNARLKLISVLHRLAKQFYYFRRCHIGLIWILSFIVCGLCSFPFQFVVVRVHIALIWICSQLKFALSF